MSYTKGKWEINSKHGFRCVIEVLCNPNVSEDEKAEANARLIAAAPELLEACKKVLTLAKEIAFAQDENGNEIFMDCSEKILEAAIAKAEGR